MHIDSIKSSTEDASPKKNDILSSLLRHHQKQEQQKQEWQQIFTSCVGKIYKEEESLQQVTEEERNEFLDILKDFEGSKVAVDADGSLLVS